MGFPRVLFNAAHTAFSSEQTAAEREAGKTAKLEISAKKMYAKEKGFKHCR